MAKPHNKTKAHPERQRIVLTVCFIFCSLLLAGGAGVFFWYAQFLQHHEFRFYPGVFIESFPVENMTYLEALTLIEDHVGTLEEKGLPIQYTGAKTENDVYPTLQLTSTIIPFSAADNEREVYAIEFRQAIDAAYAIGRDGDIIEQAKQQLVAWKYGRRTHLSFTIDREYINTYIRDFFSSYESPAQNADIAITPAGEVEIVQESLGQTFDYDSIVTEIEQQLRSFSTDPLVIALETDIPEITAQDVRNEMHTIDAYLENTPIQIGFDNHEWEFDRKSVASWLSFRSGELHVDPEKLELSTEEIAEMVEQPAQEARWEIVKNEGGALTGIRERQAAQEGRSIDYKKTGEDILASLKMTTTSDTPIPLSFDIEPPRVTAETIHELGITNLLSTGHSNMSGSPVNRRKNVARGVELLNGLLVPPDETFSLLEALKPFTEENGYVPELVIKGNETLPEVGGGLCQVGTTTFRAAMNAGLDIYERRNHSYAVSYYSDERNGLPGTDATIYDPAPDFKFINDTPGWILLQTRVDGNDLYFDFWGVSDGRRASFTPPVTSDWIQPPPLKEIPTTELAPGERKCTESAHAGVTASFTYTVDYPDGKKHEEEFRSVYKPWQAVCLVGAQPNTTQ